MKAKWDEILRRHPREANPVRIVADAAISIGGLHGGRMLPVLLLDTSERPDIAELIRVHTSLSPGDVEVQWGRLKNHEGTVALFLNFIRPVEVFMVLEFDIVRQGILVEQALTGKGIYLMRAEDTEDRLMKNFDRPTVIVEIGDTGFRETWDDLFHRHVAKNFRKNGLSRSDSRRAARTAIEELRKFGSFRMRDISPRGNEQV
jgi:hypothetical protein